MRVLFAIPIVALVGCGAPPVTTPPVAVQFSPPQNAAKVDSYDMITVRTVTGQFTKRQTVEGAACDIYGPDYTARFTSPAIVQLPLYRGDTSDVRVVCKANVNGVQKSDAATIPATNLSAPDDEGITLRTGTSGTSIEAVFSIRDKSRDRFDYPSSVTLVLR
ncbi:MAG: hypothetical protein ACWA40_10805 [Planktomarina sp.]